MSTTNDPNIQITTHARSRPAAAPRYHEANLTLRPGGGCKGQARRCAVSRTNRATLPRASRPPLTRAGRASGDAQVRP